MDAANLRLTLATLRQGHIQLPLAGISLSAAVANSFYNLVGLKRHFFTILAIGQYPQIARLSSFVLGFYMS